MVHVALCTLEDEQCGMTGRVDCVNLLPYTGEGILHVETDSGNIYVDVQVLARSMDEELLCWLIRWRTFGFQCHRCCSTTFEELKHPAAMVLKSGERGSVEKKVTLYETFNAAEAELVDP